MSKKKIILFILLAIFLSAAVYSGIKVFYHPPIIKKEVDIEKYKKILTEEEQKEWKEKELQKGESFVQLNLEIPVTKDKKEMDIRLINPPYSDFSFEIQLRLVETDTVIYQSESVSPGTIIEHIPLEVSLSEGKHKAIVEYTFYNDNGEKQEDYQVEVEIVN